jgi:hypothetical protein
MHHNIVILSKAEGLRMTTREAKHLAEDDKVMCFELASVMLKGFNYTFDSSR